jgi:uncharacterized protein YciI
VPDEIELEPLTLVLLRRPADAPDLPEAELDELQARHLAHLDALERSGALLVAGPFDDQPDERLRGLCLFAPPVEETRALVEADPAIRAGRMVADVFTWLVRPGQIAFPASGA